MNQTISEHRIINNRIRRKQQLKRNIRKSFLTLSLVIGFSLLFFSFSARARSSKDQISYKYYKSVMVESGDTLWDYADLYADKQHYKDSDAYIKEVIRMNGLSDESITAGRFIILPYYSPEFHGEV